MLRIRSGFLFFSALILLVCTSGQAQVSPTTGLPPFGSFSGGPFDTINNANLNVHLEIPVVSKPGRGGMNFSYGLRYDSSIWSPVNSSGQAYWTPDPNWGWRGISSDITGYITYAQGLDNCNTMAYQQYNIYFNWVYHAPNGTTHPFNGSISDYYPRACTGNPNPFDETGDFKASDGSGYIVSVRATRTTVTASLRFRDGTVITAPLINLSTSGSLTDIHGNVISTDGATFTDSLGMTVLSISGAAPNNVAFSYRNYLGSPIPTPLVVKYSYKNVRTNFGCTNPVVTDYTRSNVSLVSEIDLPNGTKYTFAYEPTPNYAGYATGRIQQITLPTGGSITYTYTGGSSGHIVCSTGGASGFNRQTPDGTWVYEFPTGTSNTTKITAPQGVTTLKFQTGYETSRQVTDGGPALRTVYTCYSSSLSTAPPAAPCDTTAVYLPIARRALTVQEDTGLEAKSETFYSDYGLPTRFDEYGYGSTSPGALWRKTFISYATVVNVRLSQSRQSWFARLRAAIPDCGGAGTKVSKVTYGYDSNGNPQTETHYTGGTPSTISRSYTYGSYGVLNTATDFNSHPTTYSNTSCNNSLPGTVSLPMSLTRLLTWNCWGGVITGVVGRKPSGHLI